MQPFTSHTGRVAILDWADVNTDLIIPARYLKRIERTGYGPLAFADKRYLPGGAPPVDAPERHGRLDPGFPLNVARAEGATILLVGKNFGCGSSREHAVWAIAQAGYRVLIAPGKNEGFADIFEQNAFNNGLLPIELPESDWMSLVQAVRRDPSAEMMVDLTAGTLSMTVPGGRPLELRFEVPETERERLIHGLDAIGLTLGQEPLIAAYEASSPAWSAGRLS
jgi:3-isopropylmalate/(R)-2-methylmalate dehydratase small subunit